MEKTKVAYCRASRRLPRRTAAGELLRAISHADAESQHPAHRVETGYTSSAVETYRLLTRQVIDRFLDHRLSFPDCIAALDAAFANFIPRMLRDQLPALRALLLANNEIVMKEMERRGPQGASPG